jgi:4-carboxymuconolactone decarboxylase
MANAPLNPDGLRIRKEMLGAEFVEKRIADATDFTRTFQEWITNFGFGEVWTRTGLPRNVRSMITVAMLIALNRPHELKLHVKGAIVNGVTKEELREVLLHAVAYCGFPAAVDAFRVATETLKELGLE